MRLKFKFIALIIMAIWACNRKPEEKTELEVVELNNDVELEVKDYPQSLSDYGFFKSL